VGAFYDNQAQSLQSALCPSIGAIQNVFALAAKRDPEIEEFHPPFPYGIFIM